MGRIHFTSDDLTLCACGCGGDFIKFRKTQKYINGHVAFGQPLKKMEIRLCKCGCGQSFECNVRHTKQYINSKHSNNHIDVILAKKLGFMETLKNKPKVQKIKVVEETEIRACPCGCNKTFECPKSSVKVFIVGHSGRVQIEIRKCGCGCGGEFKCKITSPKKFIYQHQHILPKEIRSCLCGCGTKFECLVASNKKYIDMHQYIGFKKQWKDPKYRNTTIKKIKVGNRHNITKPEGMLYGLLHMHFSDFKYNGVGNIFIGGKQPDFILEEKKLLIELYGDYWHANPLKYKADDIVFQGNTASDVWERDRERNKILTDLGYKILIVWEKSFNNVNRFNVHDFLAKIDKFEYEPVVEDIQYV